MCHCKRRVSIPFEHIGYAVLIAFNKCSTIEQRGKAFDPFIVDVFLAHKDELIALRQRINQTRPTFEDLVDAR